MQVIRVPILPWGMINAYLVAVPGGAVVVDCGLPGKASVFEAALKGIGLGWADVKAIFLTHGHADHFGSAAELKRLSGAPVVVHALDAEAAAGRERLAGVPTRGFARLIRRLAPGKVEAVEADARLLGDGPVELDRWGLPGAVALRTPGHAMGSISILLPGGEAIAGDLLMSGILLGGIARTGVPRRSLMEQDPGAVAASLRRLVEAGAERLWLGHGGPLGRDAVLRHAARQEALARRLR